MFKLARLFLLPALAALAVTAPAALTPATAPVAKAALAFDDYSLGLHPFYTFASALAYYNGAIAAGHAASLLPNKLPPPLGLGPAPFYVEIDS